MLPEGSEQYWNSRGGHDRWDGTTYWFHNCLKTPCISVWSIIPSMVCFIGQFAGNLHTSDKNHWFLVKIFPSTNPVTHGVSEKKDVSKIVRHHKCQVFPWSLFLGVTSGTPCPWFSSRWQPYKALLRLAGLSWCHCIRRQLSGLWDKVQALQRRPGAWGLRDQPEEKGIDFSKWGRNIFWIQIRWTWRDWEFMENGMGCINHDHSLCSQL